ncbi:sulfite exporter TauE/SafE family protein [Pseudonocardia phyllosphaerae]|uniref:sulfite exporter TauE/SafE family protein n=1 Tax=Pseudonocardia phyllosphaerae TaxID=3390502 RepID=UPI00397DE59D
MLTTWPALIAAGVVAGVAGTITGVGSVFSYPVLLWLGLPATAANVTNTVALAFGGIGGAYSSRPDTVGHTRLTLQLCAAGIVGTVAGSALLLLSPPGVFEKVVPFLVAVAALLILVPRRDASATSTDSAPRRRGLAPVAALAAVSVYNGYFAAGSSVLMIAALVLTTTLPLPTINGMKNVLVLVSDVAAALAFGLFGPVEWPLVPALAVGLLIGTGVGPPIARRLPVARLRVVIAVAGVGLAVWLGFQAY